MPVPLSVTHPKGKGLAAAQPDVLEAGGWDSLARSGEPVGASGRGAAEQAQPQAGQHQPQAAAGPETAIATHDLTFQYPDIDGRPLPDVPPVVQDMNISLPRGATCLLVGPNGAGKTTLLKVLGGKHMVPREAVRVLGEPPFHATGLVSSGALSYIGGNWERDVAFAGYSIPLGGDIPAGQMLASVPGVDPCRRERLVEALDIDPGWRMHLVSDGQRRRVQIAMGLLRPFQVLLLDEITVDLDVLGRADLLAFLSSECRERGATIVYATHIFDGLDDWPSHLLYLAGGRLKVAAAAEQLPELRQGRLLQLVVGWLREEQAEREAARAAAGGPAQLDSWEEGVEGGLAMANWNNGWAAGRLTSSLKLSSNAVMRT